MRRLLTIPALIIAFCTATVGLVLYFNLSKPRLLILHSHSRDYFWTRDVDIGIRRVLGDNIEYAVRWFYMDTNLHSWPQYRDSSGRAARRFIDQWQPDVVVAVDDDAQEYVMKYYINHPHMRLVFAGVNGELTAYDYSQATNITGILERNELSAVKDALLSMTWGVGYQPAFTVPTAAPPPVEALAQRALPAYPPPHHEITSGAADAQYLKLFPQWRDMLKKAGGVLRDEHAVARTFDWSPLRLALAPAKTFTLPAFEMRRETVTRTPPAPPQLSPAPRQGQPPPGPRIIYLGDSSKFATSDDAAIRAFHWDPIRLLASHVVTTFAEWQALVENAREVDFILLTHYHELARTDTDHTLVPPSEVVQWTMTHSPVPIIGSDGAWVADGGALAIGASPFEQGEVAARMALEMVAHSVNPRDIPVATTTQFNVFMSGEKLRALELRLPRFYEALARATNNYHD